MVDKMRFRSLLAKLPDEFRVCTIRRRRSIGGPPMNPLVSVRRRRQTRVRESCFAKYQWRSLRVSDRRDLPCRRLVEPGEIIEFSRIHDKRRQTGSEIGPLRGRAGYV